MKKYVKTSKKKTLAYIVVPKIRENCTWQFCANNIINIESIIIQFSSSSGKEKQNKKNIFRFDEETDISQIALSSRIIIFAKPTLQKVVGTFI
jgi:UDP-N-acetylglucosamine transferase subunit ALG13